MGRESTLSYEFGRFSLNPADRTLWRDEELVPLTPKAFDILLILIESGGHLVPKDDLMKRVWPSTFVEEGNLTQNVSLVRKALGENANGPQYIETVPRRGYRFVSPVSVRTNTQSNGKLRPGNETELPLESRFVLNPSANTKTATTGLLSRINRLASYKPAIPVVLIALLVLALLVAGISYTTGRSNTGETSGKAIQSIAVMPFVYDTDKSDEQTEYLDEEIAESLINSLAKLPKLRVIPRSVMVGYKGRNIDPRQIGKELNVQAIVTGRVHRRGDTVSIQADLIDLDNLAQIWGQHYDRHLSDMLLVQEEISRDVFENLRLNLNVDEQKQVEAYRLYLKGRNAWRKRTADALQQGIDYFQQAINIDPKYAPAYAGLADCYNMQVIYGVRQPKDAFPRAKEAALKALELDETLAEAHSSLAFTKFRWDRDRVEAEREFQLAIKYKPAYAPAHQWYSSYLVAFERFDEAIAEAKRAQELEPLSFISSSHLAWILYLSGKNDEAMEQSRKTLKLDPNFFPAHRYLGLAYQQKGMHQKAVAEFQRGLQLSGSPLMLALLGHAHAASGNRAEARKILAELHDLQSRRYVSSYTVAAIYAGLGEKDEAFKWLEKAHEDRDVWLMNLKVDPVFVRLKSDKRYLDLLTRAGLSP
jgi:DNA-binding winged helix-turn-helix (wHTH) protein/TolB-like protein/Tfp pilus assembly protein PilF